MNTSKTSPPADAEPAVIEGVVERIVYESPETGFFVGRLREEGNPDLITFVGNLMAVSPGETIRIHGRWIHDKKFGLQVRTESYETVQPTTVEGIEKYLGSGLIHGIGKVYAKRLIKAFGTETLRVIDEQPHRLRQVEGIGPKRAKQIREAWEEQKSIQSIMVFLQGHGISTSQAVKIYKRYSDAAVAVLRDNPYRLADDIAGIGFSTADAIAGKLDIEKDSPKRLAAGLHYVLNQAAGEGHDYLPRRELLERAASLLQVDEDALSPLLINLQTDGKIVVEDEHVFLSLLHEAESACAHHLKRLLRTPKDEVSIDAERAIAWVQKTQAIELSEEQQQAIRTAANAKVMVITGGPGTGKTTLINCLIAIFEKKNIGIQLAAPTGRAAKRMEAATGREAKTIHRTLEFSPKQGGFLRDENNPLGCDLLVVDESSMVDVQLMEKLLRAVPPYARLILVGDVDQLPSVGPGNVLMDVISSGIVPTVTLKTVFRQAAQSGIISNAHRINRGEAPEMNETDFVFVERKEPPQVVETVLELVSTRIPNGFELDALRDIQVLAPMHRGEAGVANLNTVLQDRLNPHGQPIASRGFRLGDKVIQTRNNYELEVYNGDVGVVTLVEEEAREIHVEYDDRTVLYNFDDLDNLALAYAVTVHKAQGSEYPAIVLPLVPQHYMMLQRNVLYTAVTRARKLVVIVGVKKALYMAVRNTNVTRRHTALVDRLRNTIDE